MLTSILDARNEVTLPHGRYATDPNKLLGVAVHHSVSWYSRDYTGATEEQERAAIREIDALHVSLKYGGFGYHAAAFPSGRLYQTGDWFGARAHITGKNNLLIGVVAIGRFDPSFMYPPGDPQEQALASALRYIQDAVIAARNVGGPWDIHGHNDWATLLGNGDPTACAGLLNNIGDWLSHAMALVQHEPAPIPDNPPVPAVRWFDGPGGTGIVLEERGIRFYVQGVNVFNLGDFEEGKYPGQISKLFGPEFQWLRNGGNPEQGNAFWSPDKGD